MEESTGKTVLEANSYTVMGQDHNKNHYRNMNKGSMMKIKMALKELSWAAVTPEYRCSC